MKKALVIAACLLLLPVAAAAHPGNVDANGCHMDHNAKTRHCHPERATQHNKPGPGAGGGGGGYSRPDAGYGSRPYSGRRGYTPSSPAVPGGAQGFYAPPSSSDGDDGYRKPKLKPRPKIVQTGPTGQAQAGLEPKVLDGDTLQVTLNGQRLTVRLYGIDAPEDKQPGGDICAAALRKLVAGQKLAVVPYGEDRYGRMVAVIYTTALGKVTVNQALLDSGHAWYFERYCATAGLCDSWRQSEQRARQARRGIWAKPNPIAPWDWRAGERGGKPQQAAQPPVPAAPRAADHTLRNNTYACRSIDDALGIYETLERGDINAAKTAMQRMLSVGKCAYLPDGADVEVLGSAKDHEFFKLVRPVGEEDSWWVIEDSLVRGK